MQRLHFFAYTKNIKFLGQYTAKKCKLKSYTNTSRIKIGEAPHI